MRKFVQFALVAGALLSLGACADSPIGPEDHRQQAPDLASSTPTLDQQAQGCVTDGLCYLPPVIVDPGACDPWMSLNWCGGDCMTSIGVPTGDETVQSCPGGGGGAPGGGGGTPPPPAPPGTICPTAATGEECPTEPVPADTCRTGEVIVDDLDVHGQFDALWQQSLAQGVEMGGWIVRDGANNYRLIPFQTAVYTPCGVDIFDAPPANLVSMFHTHPWTLGQSRVCDGAYTMYTGTPSPEDVQTLQQLGLSTGFFIDHTGIGKYTPTGGEQAIRIDRCGY